MTYEEGNYVATENYENLICEFDLKICSNKLAVIYPIAGQTGLIRGQLFRLLHRMSGCSTKNMFRFKAKQ